MIDIHIRQYNLPIGILDEILIILLLKLFAYVLWLLI